MAENHLKHLAEFHKLLKGYKPRAELIDALKNMELVLLTSPAATGKNSIINYLLSTDKYHHLVSDTTRHPRTNDGIPEVDGKEYWFRNEEEFLENLKEGNYITAAVIHEQQVSAINFSEFEKVRKQHRIAIAEVNINGANHIHEYSERALIIFLLPPSYEEWMRRLVSRGHVSDEEKMRRIRSARNEIRYALDVDFFSFMINDDIKATSEKINELATTHKPNDEHESAKTHAEELLDRLEKELS